MRKHLISTFAVLVMIVLAFGSTDNNTAIVPSGQPVSTPSSTPPQSAPPQSAPPLTNGSKSSTSEVDRVFAERTKQYEEAVSAWSSANELREEANAQLAELQSRIQTLELEKPIPPKFETREWGTFDRKYTTHAVLVQTDTKSVTLRKPDGEEVTVPKLKLRTEDITYIASTFSKTAVFEASLKRWEEERGALLSKLSSARVLAESPTAPTPRKPSREDIASELAAAEAKRREEARLAVEAARVATEEAERRNHKANRDQFLAALNTNEVAKSIVYRVAVSEETATITVANIWHLRAYQLRLQDAQSLWGLWAAIASPDDVDKARIKLVDFNGNEVGGSRVWGGSLIWVQKN